MLTASLIAYRASQQRLHPPPFQHNQRAIYHLLWPSHALSPVPESEETVKQQMENEANYRQLLIQGALAVLLPTEDLENDCLTALVGQILSEMIVGGGIGGKACEPWLLWEGFTKIAELIQMQLPKSKAQTRLERSNSDLVAPISTSSLFGRLKAYNIGFNAQKTFWLVLQYGYTLFTAVRFLIITIATASSLPSRGAPFARVSILTTQFQEGPDMLPKEQTHPLKQPILGMRIWSCVSTLLDLNLRMPWSSGMLSMLQWAALTGPGHVGNTNGILDR